MLFLQAPRVVTSYTDMSQITTITFFRFSTFRDKYWALSQMYLAHKPLKATAGQSFYKLMASGSGDGFRMFPDFSVSCLLQVWESQEAADDFFRNSRLFRDYSAHTTQRWTLYLKCIRSHGTWSKANPFTEDPECEFPDGAQIAVVTRAHVKWNKRLSFWRYVPHSHPDISTLKGLVYTKGIGDVPLVEMATFSLWENLEHMKAFAYRSEHVEAIKNTTVKRWYTESLFARFYLQDSEGSWDLAAKQP